MQAQFSERAVVRRRAHYRARGHVDREQKAERAAFIDESRRRRAPVASRHVYRGSSRVSCRVASRVCIYVCGNSGILIVTVTYSSRRYKSIFLIAVSRYRDYLFRQRVRCVSFEKESLAKDRKRHRS